MVTSVSIKAGIPWKGFDPFTQTFAATMAIRYANTVVDAVPLKPLFHIHGYHGDYHSNPGCYI